MPMSIGCNCACSRHQSTFGGFKSRCRILACLCRTTNASSSCRMTADTVSLSNRSPDCKHRAKVKPPKDNHIHGNGCPLQSEASSLGNRSLSQSFSSCRDWYIMTSCSVSAKASLPHSMQASTLTTGNAYFSIGALASNSAEAIVSWLLHLVRAQPKFVGLVIARHRDIGHLPLVIASPLPSRHECLPLSLKLCHAAFVVVCLLTWCKAFSSLPQTFQLSLVLRFCGAWLHQSVFHHIEGKRFASLWGQARSNSFAPKCAGFADPGPARHPSLAVQAGLWKRIMPHSHCQPEHQAWNRSLDLGPWTTMTGRKWCSHGIPLWHAHLQGSARWYHLKWMCHSHGMLATVHPSSCKK